MKSKFWSYVLYNYLKKVKSKTFIGFNIFLIISGILVSQLGSIATWMNEKFEYSEIVYVVDETEGLYSTFEQDIAQVLPDVQLVESQESVEVLDQLVKEGEITAYFRVDYDADHLLFGKYVANDFSNSSIFTVGEQILSSYNQKIAMDTAQLSQEQTDLLQKTFEMELVALDETAQTAEESLGNIGIAYISIILIFMFSYMYSVYAGQEIMYEKTSRVMEIIITSISPIKQLYGKIVYNTLYALTQLVIFMVLFTISIQVMMKNLPGNVTSGL
ncbi:MAG: ABC transporter permease, partial [Turicibacter sp.]